MNDAAMIESWLAGIELTDQERTETCRYINESGFTLRDFCNFTDEVAKEYFVRENLPNTRVVAIFRIRKAITDIHEKGLPEEYLQPVEEVEEVPQPPQIQQLQPPQPSPAVPIPQEPIAAVMPVVEPDPEPEPEPEPVVYDENEEKDVADWTTEDLCAYISSCELMNNIKENTMDNIIKLFCELELTGATLLDRNVLNDYKEQFGVISLGGRHKLRKAFRQLMEKKKAIIPRRERNIEEKPPSPPAQPVVVQPPVVVNLAPPPQIEPPVQEEPRDVPVVDLVPKPVSPVIVPVQQPEPQPEPEQQPEPVVVVGIPPMVLPEEKEPFPVAPAQPAQPAYHPAPAVIPVHDEVPPYMHPAPVMHAAPIARRWFWYDDSGRWYPYEDDCCAEIDAAFNDNKPEVLLTKGSYFAPQPGAYKVTFDYMTRVHYQVNQRTKESRPVVSDDSEALQAFRDMNIVGERPKESATEPQFPQYGGAYGGNAFMGAGGVGGAPMANGFGGQYPHGMNGYHPNH